MDINNIILHEIRKERHEIAELRLRDKQLPIDHHSERLVSEIIKLYRKKTGLGLGTFEENEEVYRFSTYLRSFHTPEQDKKLSFVKLTTLSMDTLLAKMNDKRLATGGYVVFVDYTDEYSHYLLIAMLRDTTGNAVNEKLEVTEAIHLDMGKLHICCQIDINSWQESTADGSDDDTQYMTFVKGRANTTTPDYFLDFVGCKEFSDSRQQTEELRHAIRDYCNSKQMRDRERLDTYDKVQEYCRDKASKGERVYLDGLSHFLNEDDPYAFLEFVNSGDYVLSSGFEVNQPALRKFKRVNAGNEKLKMNFDAELLDTKQIQSIENAQIVKPTGFTLLITNVPGSIKKAIKDI